MDRSGVVILGGAHGTLALARSIGALSVPVWLIGNDSALPAWSRFVHRALEWPGADAPDTVGFLLREARAHGLQGFLLIPAGDAEVRFVSQARQELEQLFRVVLPGWDALHWLCDKPVLYLLAEKLGLAIPRTYRLPSVNEAESLEPAFPVVLKPHMGGGDSEFVKAKVIRADDRAVFMSAYRKAAQEIGAENIVVQEMIPGGGESQFSYAALWWNGRPAGEFTARRTRQYPVDFGYTSSFVEVVDEPEAIAICRKLLASVAYEGLVEIELKRDCRDGHLKLLDVNPRPWAWFGLCRAAGLDLGAMLWAKANGDPVPSANKARIGAAWMYLARDVAASAVHLFSGRLKATDYLRSIPRVRSWAAFASDDWRPGMVDLPLTAWRVLGRRVLRRG